MARMFFSVRYVGAMLDTTLGHHEVGGGRRGWALRPRLIFRVLQDFAWCVYLKDSDHSCCSGSFMLFGAHLLGEMDWGVEGFSLGLGGERGGWFCWVTRIIIARALRLYSCADDERWLSFLWGQAFFGRLLP